MFCAVPRVAVFVLLAHVPLPSLFAQDTQGRPQPSASKLKECKLPRPGIKRTGFAPANAAAQPQVSGFGYDPAENLVADSASREAFAKPQITPREGGHYRITLTNDLTQQGDSYVEPGDYMSEAKAADLLSKLKPGAPFGFPFPLNSGTMMAIGWRKGDGKGHWGCDYFRAPADLRFRPQLSFEVLAMGSGKVISVQWNDYAGNVVVIEHEGQGGKKYRSIYLHLRNGCRNDREKAAGINLASYSDNPELQETMRLYKSFAERWDDQGWWGSDDQTIKVKPGEYVRRGQVIGFAGNTGQFLADRCIPIGKSGIPMNPDRPNIHLHLSFAFFNPESRKWTLIDPYGVYSTQESGGYEPGRPTRFPNFFTEPISPVFSRVPLSVFAKDFNRYADLGMPLESFQVVSNRGGEPTVSGSFGIQGGVDFCALIHTPIDHFWETKAKWERRGYRPTKAWVTGHPNGVERITAFWKKQKEGERFEFFMGNEQGFKVKLDELKLRSYRLEHRDPPATLASKHKPQSPNETQQKVVAIFLIPGPDTDERTVANPSKPASLKKPTKRKRYSQPAYSGAEDFEMGRELRWRRHAR